MSLKKIVGLVSAVAIGGITIYGMGCSSSTSSGSPGGETDSGTATKTDTGIETTHDTGTISTGGDTGTVGPSDATASDAPACFMPMTFMAIPWVTPSPLHQGACTTAQLSAFATSFMTTNSGLPTSGSTTCDACLITDVGATAHGPIISQTMSGMTEIVEVNYGGCVADLDGSKAAGSCGNTINNENDCIDTQCYMCSDIDTGGPITQACAQAAFVTGGPCAATANEPTMACQTEVNAAPESQCTMGSTLFALWCGSSTTPTDAGTD